MQPFATLHLQEAKRWISWSVVITHFELFCFWTDHGKVTDPIAVTVRKMYCNKFLCKTRLHPQGKGGPFRDYCVEKSRNMSLELGLGSTSVSDNSNQADFLSPDRPSTKWSSFWTLIISNARETAKTVSHFVPCADFVTDARTVGRTHSRMDLRTCFSGHPYTIAPKGAIIRVEENV